MSYLIREIEITEPLPTVEVPRCWEGVALVLRRRDRPVGFWMVPDRDGCDLTPQEISHLIEGRVEGNIVGEALPRRLLANSRAVVGADGDEAVSAARRARPSVTVAVCTRDHPEMLARCMHSIRRLATASDLEILIVDNAPLDNRTWDVVTQHRGVRYVKEPRPGLSFARNRAMQEASGELLAFVDDDATVDRGWLDGLIEGWSENPDAAVFTGLILPYELDTRAQIIFESEGGFRRGFQKIRYGSSLSGSPLYPARPGVIGVGCNMAFRRDLLASLGGFDEALGAPRPGGEDLDIFYRFVRAGLPIVYEPRYLAFHQHRREYKELRRQYWLWGLGFMAFIAKSCRTDPAGRRKLRRAAARWFPFQLSRLAGRVFERGLLTSDLLLAQVWGGFVGLLGEYERSKKRVRRIKTVFE